MEVDDDSAPHERMMNYLPHTGKTRLQCVRLSLHDTEQGIQVKVSGGGAVGKAILWSQGVAVPMSPHWAPDRPDCHLLAFRDTMK